MITEEQMVAIGGKVWTSRDGRKRRVYLPLTDADWMRLVGLDIERYKTGNIWMAALRGEKISNAKAIRLIGGAKVYWEAGQIYIDQVGDEIKADLYAAILADIAKLDA